MAQQQIFAFALMAVTLGVIIMQTLVLTTDSYISGYGRKFGIFGNDFDNTGDSTFAGLLKAVRAFSVISLVPSVAGFALLSFYAIMKQTMHIVSAVPHVLAALSLFLTFVLEAALYRHELSGVYSLKDSFDLSWGFALTVVMCVVEGVVGGVVVVLARQQSNTGYGTAAPASQQQILAFALLAVTLELINLQVVVMATDSYISCTREKCGYYRGGFGIFNPNLIYFVEHEDSTLHLLKAARAFTVISLVLCVAGSVFLVFYAVVKQTMHIVTVVPHVLAALSLFLTFVLEAALYRHEMSYYKTTISLKDDFDLSWGFALTVVMCVVEGVVGGVAVVGAMKFGQSGSVSDVQELSYAMAH